MDKVITEEQILDLLDALYSKALNGVPKVSKSVDEMVNDYLVKGSDKESAAKALIKNQVLKCGTSGFVTGFGGIGTMPISIPANISSVLYVQLRMIAAVAQIGGFDIRSDQVQTMAYACLTGSAFADIVKQVGIKAGEKFAVAALKKIPGKLLIAINKKVGFRLLTKFGTKGVINLVKLVPVAGGVIGGAVDITSTKVIANNAYSFFIKNQVPDNYEKKKEPKNNVEDAEFEDIKEE